MTVYDPTAEAAARAEELERLVELVGVCGYSTGHADTAEMLVRELLEQFEGVRRERDVLREYVAADARQQSSKTRQWWAKDCLEKADKAREGE